MSPLSISTVPANVSQEVKDFLEGFHEVFQMSNEDKLKLFSKIINFITEQKLTTEQIVALKDIKAKKGEHKGKNLFHTLYSRNKWFLDNLLLSTTTKIEADDIIAILDERDSNENKPLLRHGNPIDIIDLLHELNIKGKDVQPVFLKYHDEFDVLGPVQQLPNDLSRYMNALAYLEIPCEKIIQLIRKTEESHSSLSNHFADEDIALVVMKSLRAMKLNPKNAIDLLSLFSETEKNFNPNTYEESKLFHSSLVKYTQGIIEHPHKTYKNEVEDLQECRRQLDKLNFKNQLVQTEDYKQEFTWFLVFVEKHRQASTGSLSLSVQRELKIPASPSQSPKKLSKGALARKEMI
jgi:hypothetical protein